MKAITTCAPLLLALAIGCDDRTEAIEFDENTDQTRWTPEEESLKVKHDAIAARAAHVAKAHRAVSTLMHREILNPFYEGTALEELLPNCDIEIADELVSQQSACPNMPEEGYEVTITECIMENGDAYTGSMFVSAEVLRGTGVTGPNLNASEENPAVVLAPVKEWIVDVTMTSDAGTDISACGTAFVSPRGDSSQFILNVTNPDVEAPGQVYNATYEVSSQYNNRGAKFQSAKSEINLIAAERPENEVEHMRLRGIYRTGDLLPKQGQARFQHAESGTMDFNGNVYAEDTVVVESTFQGRALLEVPAL